MDMNRDKLARLGVDVATADSLFVNRNYTPVDATAMVEALTSLNGVADIGPMVALAAPRRQPGHRLFRPPPDRAHGHLAAPQQVNRRLRRQRQRHVPSGSNHKRRNCRHLSDRHSPRTPGTAQTIDAMTAAARSGGATGKTLVITGAATPLARRNSAARGWKVEEHAKL